MEKTLSRIMNAQKKINISRALTKGVPVSNVMDNLVASKEMVKRGTNMIPGQQFGYDEKEIKAMLQNGIKSKGFSENVSANDTYQIPIDLTGIANIMLGLGLGFPDTFQSYNLYPLTFSFKVNTLTLIEDVHPMFLDVTGILEPYFEYVYLLGGKDTISAAGQNGATAQRIEVIVYYI